MADIGQDYQIQEFLFFIVSEADEDDVRKIEELLRKIATSRDWTIGEPYFVDETEYLENQDIDEPVRTVGGVLEIYSGSELPYETDQAHYEEVRTIINHLICFSAENNYEFECELDGDHVGTIDNGKADSLITIGLLGEWKAGLRAKKNTLPM